MLVTHSGRNPGQAGGVAVVPVKPLLPAALSAPCSSSCCSERFQPGLSAGMRSARVSVSLGWPGR